MLQYPMLDFPIKLFQNSRVGALEIASFLI